MLGKNRRYERLPEAEVKKPEPAEAPVRTELQQRPAEKIEVKEKKIEEKEKRKEVRAVSEPIEKDSGTVISKGVMIEGNIRSAKAVTIRGELQGDIECEENVSVEGHVKGNITARNLSIDGVDVEGEMKAGESIVLREGAHVNGGIEAGNADISGAVQGNIICHGSLKLKAMARVKGDVYASEIEISRGAVIQGAVNIDSVGSVKDYEEKPQAGKKTKVVEESDGSEWFEERRKSFAKVKKEE